MSTNGHELLLKEEVFEIISCAMEVLNEIGCGVHEKPYENALTVEFKSRRILFRQQPHFDIFFKESKVGELISDLVVFDQIIVDTKVIDRITEQEIGQMLSYLKITGLKIGLIINFKHPKLEWKRIVR
jgi:GxxExxY protein